MLEDFVDFQNEHEDYILLMEEYSNAELFKETILCLDKKHPEWKTHKGVGSWSAELVLSILNNSEYLELEDTSDKKKLEILEIEIEDTYNRFQADYQTVLPNIINEEIEKEYEDEIYDLENDSSISSEDYITSYNKLKVKFEETFMNEITYDFINPIL